MYAALLQMGNVLGLVLKSERTPRHISKKQRGAYGEARAYDLQLDTERSGPENMTASSLHLLGRPAEKFGPKACTLRKFGTFCDLGFRPGVDNFFWPAISTAALLNNYSGGPNHQTHSAPQPSEALAPPQLMVLSDSLP